MGYDVACEEEAASPLTCGKIMEITMLPMCNSQHAVKSLQKIIISVMSYFGYAQVYTYKLSRRNTIPKSFCVYDRLQRN
jgi:hypothetical protein